MPGERQSVSRGLCGAICDRSASRSFDAHGFGKLVDMRRRKQVDKEHILLVYLSICTHITTNSRTCHPATSVYNRDNKSIVEELMKIRHRDKEWELEGRWRVRDAIKEVGLLPQTVLAVRDGRLLTGDLLLEEDDEIKLVAVISGG